MLFDKSVLKALKFPMFDSLFKCSHLHIYGFALFKVLDLTCRIITTFKRHTCAATKGDWKVVSAFIPLITLHCKVLSSLYTWYTYTVWPADNGISPIWPCQSRPTSCVTWSWSDWHTCHSFIAKICPLKSNIMTCVCFSKKRENFYGQFLLKRTRSYVVTVLLTMCRNKMLIRVLLI